jgi:simple sugar transport system ATP-binding protein/ribose transport system ATP-binding protein
MVPTVPLLAGTGLSKAYGPSRALDEVSFHISPGAIHGLLGKNGAGKSTLAQVVAGTVRPDAGSLRWEGAPIDGETTRVRRRRGIQLLGQHSSLLPDLSVTENLLLADLPRRGKLVSWREGHERAREMLREHRLELDPRARAGDLSLSEARRLGIVRVLVGEGRLVILDEPTTGLSLGERRDLLTWTRGLADGGVSFVYISHHNDEIRQLCDEFTVLRDGRVVVSGADASALSSAELSELVTGTDVREFHRDRKQHFTGTAAELRGFAVNGGVPFDLEVRAGEIVGLIGLPGSGAQETMRALAGLAPSTGTARVAGREVRHDSPRRALAAGIAYLTHDRMGEGLVADMSISDNAHLGAWPTRRGLVRASRVRHGTESDRRKLTIRMGAPDHPVSTLSGGNAQKVLLSRVLRRAPRLLLLDEPTLGVDVGAKEDIHRLVDEASRRGIGVVVRAYDPDETARLVDRALTFADGTLTGELTGSALTIDSVATAQHLGGTRD